MTATMRDQEPIHAMPPSKLGEYTVVQEIAEGTFGKVKSMYLISFDHLACSRDLVVSGRAYTHRSQGRNEVHFKTRYQHDTHQKPCST